jgi:hypothetical protein
MSIQPFKGSQPVILEKRNGKGELDFSGEQPPVSPLTFDEVYRLYFQATPDGPPSASWDDLRQWLESKGWHIRAKTW